MCAQHGAGNQTEDPHSQPDEAKHDRDVRLAPTGQHRIRLNGALGRHSFRNRHRAENDSAAEETEDGVLQSFTCFITFRLSVERGRTFDGHRLARAAIFLAADFDETVLAEGFGATSASILRCDCWVRFAVHRRRARVSRRERACVKKSVRVLDRGCGCKPSRSKVEPEGCGRRYAYNRDPNVKIPKRRSVRECESFRSTSGSTRGTLCSRNRSDTN